VSNEGDSLDENNTKPIANHDALHVMPLNLKLPSTTMIPGWEKRFYGINLNEKNILEQG
jgi:hypothetical protein